MYTDRIKPPAKSRSGEFMKLAGSVIGDVQETKEACAHYLAVQHGAFIKNLHPLAEQQLDYDAGCSGARISDLSAACVIARAKQYKQSTLGFDNYTPSAFIAAGLASGDLPALVADAVNLVVMPSYSDLIEDVTRWTKPIKVKDFKESVFSNIDVGELAEIYEGTEAKHGNIQGNGETFQLRTFGRNVLVHRHTLINNEFSVILAAVEAFVVASSRKDAILQYGVLNDNAALADGIALFHADHGNLITGPTPPFVTAVGTAMAALRSQPTASGELSNAKAAVLLVPTALEADALAVVGQLYSGNKAKIEVVSSAYLTAGAWYLLADPKHYPVVGRILLEDSKTPLLIDPASAKQLSLKYDGAGISVRLDVNSAALSHIGAVKTIYTP